MTGAFHFLKNRKKKKGVTKMSLKTIYRNVRTANYTQVSNSFLNDPEASLQAKGLLSIFLSNSPDWEINMKNIIKRSKNGRDAHYSAVKELINLGYFARIQVIGSNNKYEEMIYIFSDIKKDVSDEIERLKELAIEEGKSLKIEYMGEEHKISPNEEKETDNTKTPENQGNDPFPENPYAENSYPESQEYKNTKDKNTKDKNTKVNLNPNHSDDPLNTLWTVKLPMELKQRIKVRVYENLLSLTSKQILELEDAYLYLVNTGYIKPDCGKDDLSAINDYEFSLTVTKMLDTVKDIKNMRGLVKTWVEKAFDYKGGNIADQHIQAVSFYNWLED